MSKASRRSKFHARSLCKEQSTNVRSVKLLVPWHDYFVIIAYCQWSSRVVCNTCLVGGIDLSSPLSLIMIVILFLPVIARIVGAASRSMAPQGSSVRSLAPYPVTIVSSSVSYQIRPARILEPRPVSVESSVSRRISPAYSMPQNLVKSATTLPHIYRPVKSQTPYLFLLKYLHCGQNVNPK